MKNIKNSIVFKSLVAFVFILVLAVGVTLGSNQLEKGIFENHPEVSKATFEAGGYLVPVGTYEAEIGGQNATTRRVCVIGGNGGGSAAPRKFSEIGGAQSFPRQISESSLNDLGIGGHGGQETRRKSYNDVQAVYLDSPIGGNANPRT